MNDRKVDIGTDWLSVSLKNNKKKGIKMPEADAPPAFANIVTKNINRMPGNSNYRLSNILPSKIYPLSIDIKSSAVFVVFLFSSKFII